MAHKSGTRGAMPGRIVRRTGLVIALGVAAVSLSGCSIDNPVWRFGWPTGVTPQATRMRELWTWSVIAALCMGVLVWGLTFWTIAFHRKSRAKDPDVLPRQTGYNVPLELTYTALPFVIISVLFYFTVVVQNYVAEKDANPAVAVDVTAFQWNWKFGYRTIQDGAVSYDGTDTAREDALKVASQAAENRTNEEGEPRPGAIHGRDPGDLSYLNYNKIETLGSSSEVPVLVLPTGKRVQFRIVSADVIHAFWVPEFLFKRDVMPNPAENRTDNVFQISEIEKEGAFVGRCAELCGTYHAMMNFEVRAVSPEQFDRYIKARMPVADGGQDLSNAEALQLIGEPPVATSTYPFDTDRTIRQASQNAGR